MPTLILSVSGARGIVGDGLDEQVAFRLADAFASVVGAGVILIGRDSRRSGPQIARAAADALAQRGCTLRDLGVVATPTVQVAVEAAGARGGVVVTASHNPPAWNALKFIGPAGTFLAPPEMKQLLDTFRCSVADRLPPDGGGRLAAADAAGCGASLRTAAGETAVEQHVQQILGTVDASRIRSADLKVVVDAVHGAGSVLVEPLLDALGVRVAWIAREPNGDLPPQPEPCAERLQPLLARVRKEDAAVGFGLDPDGDRCALVTPDGMMGEEWTLPLATLARLREGSLGPLVTNLSTSSRIDHLADRFGVTLLRTPVGEANVVARMREERAIFGGEGNGGVIDPTVHLGRDAGVAIARLLVLEVSGTGVGGGTRGGIREAAEDFPVREMLKRKLTLDELHRPLLMDRLRETFGDPQNEEDGLWWSREKRWLHVRPSGTEPVVRVMAEAESGNEAGRLVEAVFSLARELEQ
ncbi:MAG: hypothetical protein KAY24_10875 [Candidatus Eisenbacteria sp.]|nr:hypothetical protein [Candidatus Eisenbacteria bacterium]